MLFLDISYELILNLYFKQIIKNKYPTSYVVIENVVCSFYFYTSEYFH
jgi:hypothetical protein